MKNIKSITLSALLCAVALMLSYIESLIPAFLPIPGIKLGLANIVSVFLLYKCGFKYAFTVSLLRVTLSVLLFGNLLTLAYSLAGALLSLLVMFIIQRTGLFSEVGVSIVGGICHNAAQIAVASILMSTSQIIYYLPALVISGTVTGAVIGIGGALLIKKINLKERY